MIIKKFDMQLELNNSPFFSISIYDIEENISYEDVYAEVVDIIKSFRKEVTYIDDGGNKIIDAVDLTDNEFENTPYELQMLSTFDLKKILKKRKPEWFKNPLNIEEFEKPFELKEVWFNTRFLNKGE